MAASLLCRGVDPLERRALGRAQLGRLGLAPERVVAARPLPLPAPGRLRRRDERERARGRRAVVVGRPEREVDERGRKLVEDAARGDRVDSGGRLVLARDDDAAALRGAEAHREDGALLDLVPDLVCERPRERARRDQRIDRGVGHRPSLAPASALDEPYAGRIAASPALDAKRAAKPAVCCV